MARSTLRLDAEKFIMDKWFRLIVEALKTQDAHPDIRRAALARAGVIAQAYLASDEVTLTEVFGSFSGFALQDGSDHKTDVVGGTGQ
jgi:hypothetical protein